MGTLPNKPRNTFASWGSNTLTLQLGDSWNVEALRKDTPCRSEGTLAKNALQPVEMWSCQGSRCCTLCLPLQRCESKVVLVGICRNICTYDICTQKKNIITQPVEQCSTFFFSVILVSWQYLLNRHQNAGRYFSPHPLATGASRTYIIYIYIYLSYAHPTIKEKWSTSSTAAWRFFNQRTDLTKFAGWLNKANCIRCSGSSDFSLICFGRVALSLPPANNKSTPSPAQIQKDVRLVKRSTFQEAMAQNDPFQSSIYLWRENRAYAK